MMDFIQRYRNAKKAIAQIKAGEWEPSYNPISREHLTAHRGPLELWIGNGAWFCDMHHTDSYFGYIWRHWVWWAAARRMKRAADKKMAVPTRAPVL